jgi:hypothetical protein
VLAELPQDRDCFFSGYFFKYRGEQKLQVLFEQDPDSSQGFLRDVRKSQKDQFFLRKRQALPPAEKPLQADGISRD